MSDETPKTPVQIEAQRLWNESHADRTDLKPKAAVGLGLLILMPPAAGLFAVGCGGIELLRSKYQDALYDAMTGRRKTLPKGIWDISNFSS